VEKQLALIGDTLEEGLQKTIFPFFKGISGRKSSITKLVKKLELEPSTKLKGLDGGVKRGLISYLTLQLMKQGARPETVAELTEDRHIRIRSRESTQRLRKDRSFGNWTIASDG
jgi:hypothetical protein